MAAVQIQTRRRSETPERWNRALQRAIANGIEVFTANDSGERFVTSASKLDTLYRTDGYACTCEAALSGDSVCQHRAAVRFVLGWLPEPSPSAPALVANPPALVDCAACNGCGSVYSPSGGWRCEFCQGRGNVPAHHTSESAPALPLRRAA